MPPELGLKIFTDFQYHILIQPNSLVRRPPCLYASSVKEFIIKFSISGFQKPSAIQQRAIVPCVKGHDVIAQAQSGTGKTATFSISILQQVDTKLNSCQALVLAPTRELAQQIQKVVMALGDYMGAQCHACIGGTSVREDMHKLNNGIHIVVGTYILIIKAYIVQSFLDNL